MKACARLNTAASAADLHPHTVDASLAVLVVALDSLLRRLAGDVFHLGQDHAERRRVGDRL
jgi:hypothetical protein